MIEVMYTVRSSQIVCDVLRMKVRVNETYEDFKLRAAAAVERKGGKISHFGV